jgi:hypothetical protein
LHHRNPTPSLHQQSAQLQCSGAQFDCGIHIILSTVSCGSGLLCLL